MALVLKRKQGESFLVGDTEIVILTIEGGKCKIAVSAPSDVKVLREELIRDKEEVKRRVFERNISEDNQYYCNWCKHTFFYRAPCPHRSDY